ncbi:MAG: ribonuclease R [Rhodospirillales bacterium CG15_BIG_FIL_POST_REV_8_21_14_020_66_15]|nr:MAG: ribonuclease R [Rhodospirillales bacterium CG15_BIG_FIL_POST_REV_8_21_14_020_66_15]
MAKNPKSKPPFPTREEILEFIQSSPKRVGKREIARAFKLGSEGKVMLREILKDLETGGVLQRGRGKRFAEPGTLPEVTVLHITGIDAEGELLARPETWDEAAGPAPAIYMHPERKGQQALGTGDRVLARLERTGRGVYWARTIRRLPSAPATIMGVYREIGGEGRIESTDRRAKQDFIVPAGQAGGAKPGDLVRAQVLPGKDLGLRKTKVTDVLGGMDDPRSISLISIHEHELPSEFPPDALDQAKAAGAAPLGDRVDLRDLPLVTIDGADARDFDDAVFAEPDPDRKGGWHLVVAIADVSWYVRPGDALDRSAYDRGNSVYFPDRVVPMLPHELSTGWCSLNPKEDRPCLAAHLWIDEDGNLKRHRFERAMMRSAARLTYEQVQAARDGRPDDATDVLTKDVIAPLYGAYAALARNRHARGVLELDLAERKVNIDDRGRVTGIVQRARFDSHRLIEEFMITANVAAAEALEKKKLPCMYRIHDQPSPVKIGALAEALATIGLKFSKGQVMQSKHFNQVLAKAKDGPFERMVQELVLRSQAQAEYAPDNIGHFGLALRRYCHFTSPIRRYSDLLVHRALIRGGKMGEGALETDHRDFAEMGQHLSFTERRAAAAERAAVDRFTTQFLSDRVGATFRGRVNGVTRFGLFITLDDTGADGLIPIRSLPDDYYIHDEAHNRLRGRSTGRTYVLGEAVEVRLVEARPLTGGMVFELMDGGTEGGGGRARGRLSPGGRPSGGGRKGRDRQGGRDKGRKGKSGGKRGRG